MLIQCSHSGILAPFGAMQMAKPFASEDIIAHNLGFGKSFCKSTAQEASIL